VPAAPTASARPPPLPDDAGTGWSGEIYLSVAAPARHEEKLVTLSVMGDRLRYIEPNKIGRRTTSAIVDVALRRMVFLPEGTQKYAYVDAPLPDLDAGAPPFTKTGKKVKVGDLECDEYVGTRGKATTSVCIAEGIPFVDIGILTNVATAPPWMKAMSFTKRFPLRVVVTDEAGAETLRVMTSRAQAQRMVEALFLVPMGATPITEAVPGPGWKPGRPE
jgi:hypothetical protein